MKQKTSTDANSYAADRRGSCDNATKRQGRNDNDQFMSLQPNSIVIDIHVSGTRFSINGRQMEHLNLDAPEMDQT